VKVVSHHRVLFEADEVSAKPKALTNGLSKKLESFKAAVDLYFDYYNFVRLHKTLRMTLAMAGGVTAAIWTIDDLIEAA